MEVSTLLPRWKPAEAPKGCISMHKLHNLQRSLRGLYLSHVKAPNRNGRQALHLGCSYQNRRLLQGWETQSRGIATVAYIRLLGPPRGAAWLILCEASRKCPRGDGDRTTVCLGRDRELNSIRQTRTNRAGDGELGESESLTCAPSCGL